MVIIWGNVALGPPDLSGMKTCQDIECVLARDGQEGVGYPTQPIRSILAVQSPGFQADPSSPPPPVCSWPLVIQNLGSKDAFWLISLRIILPSRSPMLSWMARSCSSLWLSNIPLHIFISYKQAKQANKQKNRNRFKYRETADCQEGMGWGERD